MVFSFPSARLHRYLAARARARVVTAKGKTRLETRKSESGRFAVGEGRGAGMEKVQKVTKSQCTGKQKRQKRRVGGQIPDR